MVDGKQSEQIGNDSRNWKGKQTYWTNRKEGGKERESGKAWLVL